MRNLNVLDFRIEERSGKRIITQSRQMVLKNI